mgnify:CR=1 FL=1
MPEEMKPREIKTTLETIALDDYDDIFSDFDYGPFETRRLSEDLLMELKGRLHRKTGKFTICFTLPQALRKQEVENMARKRLKQVFSERFRNADHDVLGRFKMGVTRILIGIFILVIDALLLFYGEGDVAITLFASLIAPAGWFGMWGGLEKIFDLPPQLVEKRDVYSKLKEAEISFKASEWLTFTEKPGIQLALPISQEKPPQEKAPTSASQAKQPAQGRQ